MHIALIDPSNTHSTGYHTRIALMHIHAAVSGQSAEPTGQTVQ